MAFAPQNHRAQEHSGASVQKPDKHGGTCLEKWEASAPNRRDLRKYTGLSV